MEILVSLAIAFWILFGAFLSVLCIMVLMLWKDRK